MMKKIVLIYFCTLFSSFAWGQSTIFAPLGSVWRYNEAVINGPEGSRQYRYTVTQDTTFGNIQARKLQAEIWQNGQFVTADEANQWVATSGDKVYYWVDGAFVLLFDFAAEKGDTIYSAVQQLPELSFSCFMPDTVAAFAYTIDSTSQITIDGAVLRVQFVHPLDDQPWVIHHQIIERVGAVQGETWFGSGQICILGGFPAQLRCYRDSEITFTGNIYNQPCDFVTATETAFGPGSIRLYPNLFDSHFEVEIPPVVAGQSMLRLFNTFGHQVVDIPLNETMNRITVPELPAGIYFYQVLGKNAVFSSGKCIKIGQ